MKSTNTDIIKDFLLKISAVYRVSLWKTTSLTEHFGVSNAFFQLQTDKNYICVPSYTADSTYKNLLLANTFFFLERKRMIRGLPVAINLNSHSDTAKFFETILLENPDAPIEKEIILDSITLRLFKLHNNICCSTNFYPLILPGKEPRAAKETLEYLYKYHNKAFSLIQEGYTLYFDLIDPAYSDTRSRTVYLRAVSRSNGSFLPKAERKELALFIKMPVIEEFAEGNTIPKTRESWNKLKHTYTEKIEKIQKPGLFIKLNLNTGTGYTDQLYCKLKNRNYTKIHENLVNPEKFFLKLTDKVRAQLPENISTETFQEIFKTEICKSYSEDTYSFFTTLQI